MAPRVLIVHNEPVLPDGDSECESERAVLQTVAAVRQCLGGTGWDVACRSVGRNLAGFVAEVAASRPDAIFNLFEGFGDDPSSEVRFAHSFELLHIPLTGCPARALRLAGNKHLAKAALAAAALPSPRSVLVRSARAEPCRLGWPVIVKPALYHGSVGIGQASVATSQTQLAARVDYLLSRYRGPVLVEKFVAGREFTVAVIEAPCLVALPAMEFEFIDPFPAKWPLVTYDAKWRPDSPEYQYTPARHGARLPPAITNQLSSLARQAYRRLGCRDYARVDFRLDAQGQPWILEVNSNPDLSPVACLAGALTNAGLDHSQFLVSMTRAALARGRDERSSVAGV